MPKVTLTRAEKKAGLDLRDVLGPRDGKRSEIASVQVNGLPMASEIFTATIKRQVGHAGSGCKGYMLLADDDGYRSAANIPIETFEFGDEIEVVITARVVKRAKTKSKRRCHNPWPAHRCDDGNYREPNKRK